MAAAAAAVYGLLGLRYAVVLGLVAGLMEVLPVLGPVLGAIAPLGVALLTDPGKTPWVLLAAVVMQQAEGYLLIPRIMDKSVGVHPLVTLLAIAAFGSVLGLAGAILAIPLAAIIQVLLNRYLLGPAAAELQQPSGRGALSVLHYDAQQLLRDIRLRDKAETPPGRSTISEKRSKPSHGTWTRNCSRLRAKPRRRTRHESRGKGNRTRRGNALIPGGALGVP